MHRQINYSNHTTLPWNVKCFHAHCIAPQTLWPYVKKWAEKPWSTNCSPFKKRENLYKWDARASESSPIYGISYMLQKCKTGHGAFTCNQPHTRPEINTEGADFVSFLWTSSPHSSTGCYQLPGRSCPLMGSRQGQPAEPATVQQLCNSS